jgi:short-subunit dehydrogenase
MIAASPNKTVVITGAASGLGKALAYEFFRLGYHLALIDIDAPGLIVLQNQLKSKDHVVTVHPFNVSKEEDILAARNEIRNTHRHINIFINNAGVSISQYFDQLDLNHFHELFNINFWGTVYCTKYFLPDLKKEKDSRLVNVCSDFALMGFPGKTAYASSKSAMMGFTNSLKTELADSSVKVCLVIPPPLDTGLVMNGKHINDNKRNLESLFLKKNGMRIDKAAKRIARKIQKGRFRIVVGGMMYLIDSMSRLFPTLLHWSIGKVKHKFNFI